MAKSLAGRIAEKRSEILATCQRNGASNVYVFGSVARGEAASASDIDFLVDLDPARSLLDHIGLQQDLEDLLGVKVDVVTRRGLHPLLRESVLAEAVPV
ncbi:MAG TPA: nucleotidyltransferase family protein [Planctomycetota bacterium]|nr:nucleotidyltransferase family protein [Planctomycetota bacterium]